MKENGYDSIEKWKKAWTSSRNDSFFVVGSKEETAGNQTCQIVSMQDNFSLVLRLPNAFSQKSMTITGVDFPYGKAEILAAIKENQIRRTLKTSGQPYNEHGQAINYLFKKDEKGWRVFVTLERKAPPIVTKNSLGSIGIDINVDHIALAEIDRSGNLVMTKKIPCNTYGKPQGEAKAVIYDAAKEIVSIAKGKEKPISIELLDFEKKKASLKEKGKKYSRMLSCFAYRQISSSLEARAFKEGVEIAKVNPAYTSMIGRVKFSHRYGLSNHTAAALAIARRYYNFSEKPSSFLEIENEKLKSAFFLPEWNRKKHVWSFYSGFMKMLKTANVLHSSTKFRSTKSLKILCDGNASMICRGSSGRLIVNNTV